MQSGHEPPQKLYHLKEALTGPDHICTQVPLAEIPRLYEHTWQPIQLRVGQAIDPIGVTCRQH